MDKILYFFSAILVLSIPANAQEFNGQFFKDVDVFLKEHVSNGLVDYDQVKTDKKLDSLLDQISNLDLNEIDEKTKQAIYINAYNLYVINKIAEAFPMQSVKDMPRFFDEEIIVANETVSLNELEKKKLLSEYGDPRFHFVLVCGALGCPPITNFAYTPDQLDVQLDQQTSLALNNPNFIRTSNGKVGLSEIFKWYESDFGKSKADRIEFINRYRRYPISTESIISYYNYDWDVNDSSIGFPDMDDFELPVNESRYIVSSTIPIGSIELKIFNNLYSQQTGNNDELTDRSSFFTTTLTALYGLSSRLNVGVNGRYRKVRNNPLPSSPFSVFGSGDQGNSRSGITALGPMIRYAPVPRWENFSIQSSFVFPIGNELAGNNELAYIDWDGPTWWTQFFNDFSIGSKFSLFTEIDLLIEDIGSLDEGHQSRVSTPITLIFSYIPTSKFIFYTIGGYSPFWKADYDYFTQFGIGSKYQFTPDLELEILYTDFSNEFLNNTGGRAETINIGLRINI